MHPYPETMLRPSVDSDDTGVDEPADAAPGALVRFVRDGPVPRASCPHCGGRLALSTVGSRWQVHRPSDVADRLTVQLGALEREELHVLVLNVRNVVIGQVRVYQGNISASVVRVGELFTEAVRRQARAIVLVHNHPSGDPTPSPDDMHLTAEAIAAGRLLDVVLLDHVIIGGGSWVSLRDRGVAFDRGGDHRAGESRGAGDRLRLHIADGQICDDTGQVYDLASAIDQIPWVQVRMYPPPHEYVTLRTCPITAWDVLATAIAHHPDSYLAYFRGYQRPMRYLDFQGRRYWRTASRGTGGLTHMLNRCLFADAEPPRRVDQGARPIPWEGPPWDVYGSAWPAWYVRGPDGVYRYDPSLDPYRRRSPGRSDWVSPDQDEAEDP